MLELRRAGGGGGADLSFLRQGAAASAGRGAARQVRDARIRALVRRARGPRRALPRARAQAASRPVRPRDGAGAQVLARADHAAQRCLQDPERPGAPRGTPSAAAGDRGRSKDVAGVSRADHGGPREVARGEDVRAAARGVGGGRAREARPDSARGPAPGRKRRRSVPRRGAAGADALLRALPRRGRGPLGGALMALFQISEPGESHAKEACTTGAVGIDLGTTNSLIAIVLGDGKPQALAIDEGSTLLPSVVHYGEGGGPGSVVVGRAARRLAAEHPRDTIVSVKRFMGRSSADPETRRLSPYRFAEGASGVVRFVVDGGRVVNPVEVSAEVLRALRNRAEDRLGIKIQQAVITVPAYFDDAQRQATKEAGRLAGLGRVVTRGDLEKAIRPLIEKTGVSVRRALKDIGGAKLDGVILVGGSTRVPAVRRYVRELFGLEPLADIDPDEVVALGAAVQADLLTSESPQHDVLLLDVTPLSLGLETIGGLVEKLILRNTTIPASATQEFTTFADGQTGMDIHVLQGERELVQDNRSLAKFTLAGVPPLPAGLARVAVTFQVDADGILSVTAREQLTGVSQTITVKPSHGLTDEEIERMLLASIEHAEEDVQARLLIDNRVEAQRILKATEKQLESNGDLLSAEEGQQIEAQMAAVRTAAEGKDHDAIHAQIEKLDQVSADFAKRVMDRGIERALKGHSVAEFDQGELSPHARKAYAALEAEETASPAEPGRAEHPVD